MNIKPDWIEDKQLLKAAFEHAESTYEEFRREIDKIENAPVDFDNLPELPPEIQALKEQVERQHAQQTPPPVKVLLETLLNGYLRLTRETMQALKDALAPSQAILAGTRDDAPRGSIDGEMLEQIKEQQLWVPVRAVNIDAGVKLQFAKPHQQINRPPAVRLRVGGEEASLVSKGETGNLYSMVFDRKADVEGPMRLIRDEDGWLIEMDAPGKV